jgi:hypothetical protein
MFIEVIQFNGTRVLVSQAHVVSIAVFIPSGLVSPPKEPLWTISLADGSQLRVDEAMRTRVVEAIGVATTMPPAVEILAQLKEAVAATPAPAEAKPTVPEGSYTKRSKPKSNQQVEASHGTEPKH